MFLFRFAFKLVCMPFTIVWGMAKTMLFMLLLLVAAIVLLAAKFGMLEGLQALWPEALTFGKNAAAYLSELKAKVLALLTV